MTGKHELERMSEKISGRKVLVIYDNKLRWGEIEKIRSPASTVVVWLSVGSGTVDSEEYPLEKVILLPEDEAAHSEFLKAVFGGLVENIVRLR